MDQYLPRYAPGAGKPVFEDDEMFSATVPLSGQAQVTPEVTGEVLRLLAVCDGALPRQELQSRVGINHDEHFRLAYMVPALDAGLIERTIPDKPRGRFQKYRLTGKGRDLLKRRQENTK